jgi:hypothetical protein
MVMEKVLVKGATGGVLAIVVTAAQASNWLLEQAQAARAKIQSSVLFLTSGNAMQTFELPGMSFRRFAFSGVCQERDSFSAFHSQSKLTRWGR